MLALLRIKNLAIIDGLELEFSPGLNIITGETGAGKSIIVGGLKLLLGEKADSGIVRRGEKEGVVEGLFEKGGNEFAVRRVISQDGKNRIYLNGSIASLKELRDFGGALAEISGQHAFQALLNRDAHIEILDSFAGIGEEVREFRDSYQKLLETRKRLNEKIEARRTADQKADLLRFQISEIGKSGLSDGLDERLEQESLLLRNAGKVKGGYDALIAVMESGENPLIDGANRALKILNDLKKYDPEAERFLPVFGNMLVELKEARREIERLNEKVVTDEGRLSEVEEKLSAIGKLKRKYGRTIGEILDFFGSSERELAAMENASGEIEELNKEAETLERRVLSEALKISDKRKKAAGVLSERVAGELQDLAMKGALFECRVEGGEGSLTENGFDKVEFLIETNPKEGP
ncbi:MAG: AAA family ATPase, partial [Deltaproteobacteria bacterium]|nr:AAA family ATPase [Deltaproteobacteria bacterium]